MAANPRNPTSRDTPGPEGKSPPGTLSPHALALLNSPDPIGEIQKLKAGEQMKFVTEVDLAYPKVLTRRDAERIEVLGNVCSIIDRLPVFAELPSGLRKRTDSAAASGGFTSIWRGELKGREVAIKTFRRFHEQHLKKARRILWKRVPMWRKLSHPNILPFHGVDTTVFQLALVYDWGPGGNISQYLAVNPRAPRPPLLHDVTKGLEYLHDLNIIHGNLKRENVIINGEGRACLTDYGLAQIFSDPDFDVETVPFRWLPPEVTNPPRGGTVEVESKAADIFAFGMLAPGVFARDTPSGERNETALRRISQGSRLEKPEGADRLGLTPQIWELLESSVRQDPKQRPKIQDVAKKLGRFAGSGDDPHIAFKVQDTAERGGSQRRPRTKSAYASDQNVSDAVQPRIRAKSQHVQQNPRLSAPPPAKTRADFAAPQTPANDPPPQPQKTAHAPVPRAGPEADIDDPPKGAGCCCIVM